MKICIVNLNSYIFFTENKNKLHAGGTEKRLYILANELKNLGYEIIYIIYDADNLYKNNIKYITTFKYGKGIKILRGILNTFKLFKAMKKANADVYIQSAQGLLTFQVFLFCKLFNKKFIYWLAHDDDAVLKKFKKNPIIKALYLIGLKNADLVIAQNGFQKKYLIKKRRLKNVFIIRNPIVVEESSNYKKENFILWVGRLVEFKRPEIILKLAEKLQEYKFVVIGHGPLENYIKKEAKKLNNVIFLGFQPYEKTFEYFKRAKIFINTSYTEGFPNTFLEAWLTGTPVVSLEYDPDGIVSKYKIGHVCRNIEEMIEKIKILMNNEKILIKIGKKAKKYVEKYHNVKKISKKFISLIKGGF